MRACGFLLKPPFRETSPPIEQVVFVVALFVGRFNKAVRDYNETRPSDVFVVNFGAHYHDNPEDDERFKADVFPILDSMAGLGDKATVVWR